MIGMYISPERKARLEDPDRGVRRVPAHIQGLAPTVVRRPVTPNYARVAAKLDRQTRKDAREAAGQDRRAAKAARTTARRLARQAGGPR